jgi:Zn-dependent protease
MLDIPPGAPPDEAAPELPSLHIDETAPYNRAFDEVLFEKTTAVLDQPEAPPSARSAWIWLLGTLGLFALSMLSTFGKQLGIVVVVLLLHETGHFLGMRLFGYRNLRMFFIPFFGAAASGKKHAAPAWQQAIVLLLGPLPGIVLAAILTAAMGLGLNDSLGNGVLLLVIINAFNLLPLVPLDGGRLLDVLFCWGRPWLAVGLQVFAAVALGTLAWFSAAWPLWLLTALLLLTATARARKGRLERVFGHNPLQMPERFEDLSLQHRRELFVFAVLLNPLGRMPALLAPAMRELHERTVSRPPRRWVAAVLLLVYLAGIAASVWTIDTLLRNTRHHKANAVDSRYPLATLSRARSAAK